jgi:hypothetical protein
MPSPGFTGYYNTLLVIEILSTNDCKERLQCLKALNVLAINNDISPPAVDPPIFGLVVHGR